MVLDYDGVCTPSFRELVAEAGSVLAPLRSELSGVIDELRARGSQVALLSNEFDREWCADIEGFPAFDHIFVGSDNRIFKPDRRAFQRVLHVAKVQPAHCLVVDDNEDNCRVARSIGCAVVHFDPTDAAASWEAVLQSRPT